MTWPGSPNDQFMNEQRNSACSDSSRETKHFKESYSTVTKPYVCSDFSQTSRFTLSLGSSMSNNPANNLNLVCGPRDQKPADLSQEASSAAQITNTAQHMTNQLVHPGAQTQCGSNLEANHLNASAAGLPTIGVAPINQNASAFATDHLPCQQPAMGAREQYGHSERYVPQTFMNNAPRSSHDGAHMNANAPSLTAQNLNQEIDLTIQRQDQRQPVEEPNFITEPDGIAVGALTRTLANPFEENSALNLVLSQTKIVQVGLILQMIAAQGDFIPHTNAFITPFHSHEAPNINILLYYVVVSYNAGLHDQQAPCVLILIERLCQMAAQQRNPVFINSRTIHRLILTSVLITSKMFNDTYYTNQYIAQIGGVTLDNINELERFFMQIIDWNLYISTQEFQFYEQSLVAFQQTEASMAVPPLPFQQRQPVAYQTMSGSYQMHNQMLLQEQQRLLMMQQMQQRELSYLHSHPHAGQPLHGSQSNAGGQAVHLQQPHLSGNTYLQASHINQAAPLQSQPYSQVAARPDVHHVGQAQSRGPIVNNFVNSNQLEESKGLGQTQTQSHQSHQLHTSANSGQENDSSWDMLAQIQMVEENLQHSHNSMRAPSNSRSMQMQPPHPTMQYDHTGFNHVPSQAQAAGYEGNIHAKVACQNQLQFTQTSDQSQLMGEHIAFQRNNAIGAIQNTSYNQRQELLDHQRDNKTELNRQMQLNGHLSQPKDYTAPSVNRDAMPANQTAGWQNQQRATFADSSMLHHASQTQPNTLPPFAYVSTVNERPMAAAQVISSDQLSGMPPMQAQLSNRGENSAEQTNYSMMAQDDNTMSPPRFDFTSLPVQRRQTDQSAPTEKRQGQQ